MVWDRKYTGSSNSLIKLFFLIGAIWLVIRAYQIQQNATPAESGTMSAQVTRVIDGDTMMIAGGQRVRLLGVDTPETKHPNLPPEPFGAEATQLTASLVEGKTVRLVFDKERYDDYRRVLAFVYFDNDRFLNEELVSAGLATAEPRFPFRSDLKKKLISAEEEAKSKKLGIWSIQNE